MIYKWGCINCNKTHYSSKSELDNDNVLNCDDCNYPNKVIVEDGVITVEEIE